MGRYRIEFTPHADRQLRKLPRAVQARLACAIDGLASEPRPPQAKRLRGPDDAWRLRVGTYRVVYRIEDGVLVVLVLKLGHRKDIYG